MKVPFGAFMPDRAFVPGSTKPNNGVPGRIDLPVNVGVIKCGEELILFNCGSKRREVLVEDQQLRSLGRPAGAA